MDSFHLKLFTLFFCYTVFMYPISHSLPTNKKSLFLPLKAIQIPSKAIPNPPNKLPFHHNVSLTVSLAVGTPPQPVTLVLDTGSQLSWLHCSQSSSSSSTFIPHLSSSYTPISCSSLTCTHSTPDFTLPISCDPKTSLCHTILSYADASSVEGNLATETFHLHGPTRFVFGCMQSGSSSNPDEDSKSTGLLGMNRGQLSFVSQSGLDKFSYCISGRDSSGVLLLGDADIPWLNALNLNYTPLIQIPTPLPNFDRIAYTVRLQGIRVSGTPLPLPESAFEPDHTGAGQTMVDSGTQFTFLLGPVYAALKSEFLKRTAGVLKPVEDPNFVFQGAMDLCYKIGDAAGQVNFEAVLPSVSLVLSGAEIRVSGEKLVYKVGGMEGVYCVTFGNSDLLGLEAFVIGHHQQQNMWVEFDLANSRVGLREFSCDVASRRMGLVS